jgi:hypothetical protein
LSAWSLADAASLVDTSSSSRSSTLAWHDMKDGTQGNRAGRCPGAVKEGTTLQLHFRKVHSGALAWHDMGGKRHMQGGIACNWEPEPHNKSAGASTAAPCCRQPCRHIRWRH